MRIIVFSDTHGDIKNTREIFSRNEDADTFIFLGDGERELERVALCYPDKNILSVSGNCDYGTMTPSSNFHIASGEKIFYTHGHMWGVKISTDKLYERAKELGTNIVLFGHTHVRHYEYRDGVHILNPGSVSCPRDGKRSGYAFVDITKAGIVCNHVDL